MARWYSTALRAAGRYAVGRVVRTAASAARRRAAAYWRRRHTTTRRYSGGLRHTAAFINRSYQRNVNTIHQVLTVGPITMTGTVTSASALSSDGRVVYPHYYAPAIITQLRGFYETVIFNKVTATFDFRNLRVSLSTGDIT